MKISIVIPTFNRANYIDRAFRSIRDQIRFDFADFEIVVVSDGSTDNTDTIVERWSLIFDIKYIKQNNAGVCVSRNVAIKNAKYDIILFLDDDAVMESDCLFRISEAMNTEFAIVGRVLPRTENIWRYFAGHYSQGDEIHESNSFLETIAVFRKEIFDNVGYLNEKIDYGSEGEEYFNRLKKTNYKLMYHPEVIVYHDYSSGILKFIKKQYKFGEKMLYVKNIKLKSVFNVIKNYRKIKHGGNIVKKDIFNSDSIFEDILTHEKIFFIILSKIGVLAHLFGTIVGFYKYKMRG